MTPKASAIRVCFQASSFSSKALAWLGNVFSIVEFIIPMSLGSYAEIGKEQAFTQVGTQDARPDCLLDH